jgi:hypothetical protein
MNCSWRYWNILWSVYLWRALQAIDGINLLSFILHPYWCATKCIALESPSSIIPPLSGAHLILIPLSHWSLQWAHWGFMPRQQRSCISKELVAKLWFVIGGSFWPLIKTLWRLFALLMTLWMEKTL